MDPNACYERIRAALVAGDVAGAQAAALDLAEWLNKRGCYPEYFGKSLRRRVELWAVLNFLMELNESEVAR